MQSTIKRLYLAALLTPAFAAAENDETPPRVPELRTTVVTADLWRSAIADTNASVTILDSTDLAETGADHFENVIPSLPNLTWTGGTSRPRYLQIRGIGENSQFEGETPDASVRFLVDDLDFTGLGGVAGLFDVKQVEVLRGPQAGSFGANASGGVVRVETRDPSPVWRGFARAGIGTDSTLESGLAIGGPLIAERPEDLMFRLALHQHSSDGFQENNELDEDDTNERDEWMSRLKLRWDAPPDWTWDGTLFFGDQNNGYDEFSLSNADHETFSDEPGRDTQESLAGSLKGTWSGNAPFTFTILGSGTRTDSLYSFDADWEDAGDPRSYDGFTATERVREVANLKLRLDSDETTGGWINRWTAGAYFHYLDEQTDVDSRSNKQFVFTEQVASEYTVESAALFGRVAHDFTPDTRLILGLRGEYHSVEVSSGGTFVRPGGGDSSRSEPLFGGKLTLEHDLDPDRTVFASVARGYRAAGANVAGFVPAGSPLVYGDETLWNFEAGLRGAWADGRVTGQLTAFYLRRENTQLRDSAGSGGFFTYFTDNGDGARHYGLESEATWRITDAWTANATLGLLETHREAFSGLPDSRELSNSPSYNYSARLSYDPGNGFFANATVQGRDSYFESNSHDQERDAFTVVNTTLGYRWDQWSVRLTVRNLFDEEYAERVFFFPNELDTSTSAPGDFAAPRRFEALAAPRHVGLDVTYRF